MKTSDIYALSIEQTTKLIATGGHEQTVLVQGHMGTGKSSIIKALANQLPQHTPCYFDCTTKMLGDITIPKLKALDGQDYVRFATNEELGVHLDKPIVLMIDEFGKAQPSVQKSLLRLMLERKIGSYTLHPDSIVFATTNLATEGVGDLLPAHACNRITTIQMRKPSHMEWIEWGIANGIDHSLLGWVKDNPQVMQSFTEVKDPDQNPYIFHPQAQRAAFVTPRSLEKASSWIQKRSVLDDTTVTASLMGTIGERGAMDLMAFVSLADQLPTAQQIKDSPETAPIPTSASAVCMVVYRVLTSVDRSWINSWMKYLLRLDKEAQGLFANGVRAKNYPKDKLAIVASDPLYTQWAIDNAYMFTADK